MCPQGIVPRSASQAVGELFVPADQLSAATAEAATLPAVDISKLDMEWVCAEFCSPFLFVFPSSV